MAYEFVSTIRACGFEWVIVQEHTVELPENGWTPQRKHIPHRLVCRNSEGAEASIVAIVKTQGSDAKLIGQRQPYYEAKGLDRVELGGRAIPPLVVQISDGENGGVMMNEFPDKVLSVMRECSGSATPGMLVTEYLEQLADLGITEHDFPIVQPLFQKRIWDRMDPGDGPDRLEQVIGELKREDDRFHMEGGSWTNSLSWVRGYENVLGPMEKVSARFHEVMAEVQVRPDEQRHRNAPFHLLCSQTSCYRYWGPGPWTDYGREICRRLEQILHHDF